MEIKLEENRGRRRYFVCKMSYSDGSKEVLYDWILSEIYMRMRVYYKRCYRFKIYERRWEGDRLIEFYECKYVD
jgi:hypothetical protein